MNILQAKNPRVVAIVNAAADQRGFTLIETMVALCVLMVSVVGVASLGAYAIAYNSGAGSRELALMVAQQQMEQLRSVPFNDASLNASTGASTVTSGGQNFAVVTTVVDALSAGTPALKTITIQVTPQNQTRGWAGCAVIITDQRAANTLGVN
jgi:Tfp pilus assembly protein PilV